MRLLQEVRPETLERAAADAACSRELGELEARLATRRSRRRRTTEPVPPDRPVAFFCAEYGVHYSLPVYSGGLGVLAGDILKETSTARLPLVAVGLMYRHGYFRQRIDASGWQHEYWVDDRPGPRARRARHRRRRRAR